MENITHPLELIDQLLFISSVIIGLVYFKHYLFSHIAIAFSIFITLLSVLFGEAFFNCNSIKTVGLYELFKSLKHCLPLRSLMWHYISAALFIAAISGYIRFASSFSYTYLKKHITRHSAGP